MSYSMFTQIVDDHTFIIGDRTYCLGDKIDLTTEEEAQLAAIRDLDKRLRAMRQALITQVHLTDRTYLPDIVSQMHDLNLMGMDMRVAIPKFILDLNRRMGGRLPLDIDETLSSLIVRERRQGEALNYTVAAAMDMLMMTNIREQRELAILITGKREDVEIDVALDREIGLQPVIINRAVTAEEVEQTMAKFLAKFPRPATVSCLVGTDRTEYILNPFEQRRESPGRKDPWQPITDFAKTVKARHLMIVIQTGPTPDRNDHWNIVLANLAKDTSGKLVKTLTSFTITPKGELDSVTHEKKAEIKGVDLDALGRCL
jgi:hypothetical protein